MDNSSSVPTNIEVNAIRKLSYGLFVLTCRLGDKDNGCIINTAMQLTETPKQIAIGVNKANYTHDMIKSVGAFNLSVLSEQAPYKVFQHFGFQSGKNVNKFENCEVENRTQNGILYIAKFANAVISCKVISTIDCGTHTLFIGEVNQAVELSTIDSMTYSYYFKHVKPKPQSQEKKGYICKICGYVHEGELPDDYICPICKHTKEDFEPIQPTQTSTKTNEKGATTMKKYICSLCGYEYDENQEPILWKDLPDDWTCPLCGASKADFYEAE